MKPLAIDLFCGLGGWSEGLLSEGWQVIGFDIERHRYGDARYPAQLVIQDVLTLHGAQFKDADLIVASPPCQGYSYRAMPWSRAKALPPPDNSLFEACFRIQREACEAAGRHIPMIVENVRGAQKWVGRSRWNYGSFHLWGDVPALMPMTKASVEGTKVRGIDFNGYGTPGYKAQAFNGTAEKRLRDDGAIAMCDCGHTESAHDGGAGAPCSLCSCINPAYRRAHGFKTTGHVNQRDGHSHTRHLTNQAESDGVKQAGISGRGDKWFQDGAAQHASKSPARKAASAMIAKIPYPLARYIAQIFHPRLDMVTGVE